MNALLLATALLAGPVNLPDTAVNISVKSARPATVFNSLSQMAGSTIDASCLGDARFALDVQNIPLPVLFDLLSAKLDVRFEGLEGGVIHAVCSKDPELPSASVPGAVLADLPSSVKQFFGTGESGVLVRDVVPQTAAAAIGLHENDVLTALDGKPVKSIQDVEAIMSQKQGPTQKTELALLRDQQSWSLAMVVVAPANAAAQADIVSKMLQERDEIHDAQVRGDGDGLPTFVDSNGGNAAQPMKTH